MSDVTTPLGELVPGGHARWIAGYEGFVVTGFARPNGARPAGRLALPLEMSFPGVFAIGDLRAGSTKRVPAAVGEGAAVVAQIDAALALQSERMG